jgi:hypothetical protein
VQLVRAGAGSAYDDIVGLASIVRERALDWTIVRLPMLTNTASARPAVAGYVGDARIKLFSLSRHALARFLLTQIDDATWVRKAPVLCNG